MTLEGCYDEVPDHRKMGGIHLFRSAEEVNSLKRPSQRMVPDGVS